VTGLCVSGLWDVSPVCDTSSVCVTEGDVWTGESEAVCESRQELGFCVIVGDCSDVVEQVMPAHKQTSTAEKTEVQLLPG